MSGDVYWDGPLCMLSCANEVEGSSDLSKGSDTSAMGKREKSHTGDGQRAFAGKFAGLPAAIALKSLLATPIHHRSPVRSPTTLVRS
jgi:hypothetical protein